MAKEEFIGSKNRDLVFRTAGRVSILIGDKYYPLNFDNTDNTDKEYDNTSEGSYNSSVIITDSINSYLNGSIPYPGDNYLIFSSSGDVYRTLNKEYYPYYISTKPVDINSFDKTISFLGSPAFKVSRPLLINNLNAQLLNGKKDSDFILKSDNLSFENIIVNSIKSKDGKFSYINGVLTVPESNTVEKNYISNKISIGLGLPVVSIKELDTFKYIPYDNTIIEDLFSLDSFDYKQASQLVSFANSDNSIDSSSMNTDEIIDLYEELSSFIYLKKTSSDIWNNYPDIKNKYCDINLLPYNKSCYKLTVESTKGLSLYDELDITMTYDIYKKGDIISDDACNIDDTYIKETITDKGKCCITQIGDGYVCVVTNLESNLYKYGEESVYNIDTSVGNITYKMYDYGENYECYTNKIINFNNNSSNGYIGDLTGLEYIGNILSCFGLYIKDDCYLINPKIYKEFKIINNIDAQDIDISTCNDFTFLDDGVVSVKGVMINGLEVNIYSTKSCYVKFDEVSFEMQPESYNTFRCVPISETELKWIKTN